MNKDEEYLTAPLQEEYLIETFPLIRKIARKKLKLFSRDSIEDLVQTVALKLWRWKNGGNGHDMSNLEWQKLANKAAHNEVKNFYSQINPNKNDQQINVHRAGFPPGFSQGSAGNTDHEVSSLLTAFWSVFCALSLREKYALLLKRPEFIHYLTFYRISDLQTIAETLELTTEKLGVLIDTFPLTDRDIASFLEQTLSEQITSKQVKEARLRAKTKLQNVLLEKGNGRALYTGTTQESAGQPSERSRTGESYAPPAEL